MDDDRYQGDITLVWDGEYPAGIEDVVVSDIRVSLPSLGCPEDLMIHTVFLSEDMRGPSVLVAGMDGSPYFHCVYFPSTEWVDGEGNCFNG